LYRIENEDVLYRWLARHGDRDQRLAMLDWMVEVANDPKAAGTRLPGVRAPVYLAFTPVRPFTLVYLVADEYRTVRLIKFGSMP
jgi:hypothetical protein